MGSNTDRQRYRKQYNDRTHEKRKEKKRKQTKKNTIQFTTSCYYYCQSRRRGRWEGILPPQPTRSWGASCALPAWFEALEKRVILWRILSLSQLEKRTWYVAIRYWYCRHFNKINCTGCTAFCHCDNSNNNSYGVGPILPPK